MSALLCELCVLGDLCVEIFSCFCFFRSRMSRPAVHLFLREPDLRQDTANILRNESVDRFCQVIESRHRGHDDRAGLLCLQHVFQMNAIEAPTSLFGRTSILPTGWPRMRLGSCFKSPEVMPSSSVKSRWPASVTTRCTRATRVSSSSNASVF